MRALDFSSPAVVLRLQVRIALLIPLLATRVIAPGDASWAIASVVGVTLFALLHRRSWQMWLVPASAIVAAIPVVPTWLAFVVAVGCGVFLTFQPPPVVTTKRSAILWVISVLLRVVAIGVIGLAILTTMNDERSYAEAQSAAAEEWNAPLIAAPADGGGSAAVEGATLEGSAADGTSESDVPGESASADARTLPTIAAISFSRPGSTTSPVTEDTLFIRPGVTRDDLRKGPGLYPGSAAPGQLGNIAIAGHRTGWGAPFAELDQLVPGDRITVEDPEGAVFEYQVADIAYVMPDEVWVLGPDPLDTGKPTLTLTTCDPPGVNSRRLVVWGTLVDAPTA